MKYYARSPFLRSIHHLVRLGAATLLVAACSSESSPAASTERQPTEPGTTRDKDAAPGDDGPAETTNPTKPEKEPGSTTDDTCKKAPPSDLCGVVPQCGCEANETCDVPDATGSAVCVEAGQVSMGRPCSTTSSCARGLTCIFGTCHAFCSNPGGACDLPGTGACEQIKTTDGVDVPNLTICRVACAPHDPASCGGKTSEGIGACYADGKGGSDCQTGSEKVEGDECSSKDPCGPGLVCTTAKSSSKSTCKRWCRVGKDDCGSGKTCNGFNPAVKVGDSVYGACP